MTARRKDFQKAASLIHEFQLKLSEDAECAELRDSLNLALLHMQKYYRALRTRLNGQDKNGTSNGTSLLATSLRGLSPMTPFRDAPDKFQWRWINLDSPKIAGTLPLELQTTLPTLIEAAKSAHNDEIVRLLKQDPDRAHEIDGLGRTAVMYAVQFNHLETLQVLLEHGSDCNAVAHDGSTAVHRACHNGNHEALQILLNHNVDLSLNDMQGRAPIHWACTHKSRDCLALLLEHHADANVRDKDGMTACMWACRMDNIEHFALLSSNEYRDTSGDDGELEHDNIGRTWMHWSVRRTEPLECLKTLMNAEVSTLRDEDGKTPLHIAAEQGSLAAAKVILDIAGTSCLEERDQQGRTPLIIAVIGGHGELVNFLLSQGAELASVDDNGATAWDYSRGNSLHYCMLIIASYIRQRSEQQGEDAMTNVDVEKMVNGAAIEQLQINGNGDSSTIYYGNKPVEPPHPPSAPPTPRTPRGSGNMTPRMSRPRTPVASPSWGLPPTPTTHNGNATESVVILPQTPKTTRSFGIKRSPSTPIESNGDGEQGGDSSERTSSGGKKRRSDMDDRSMTVMSLVSVDGSDDVHAESAQAIESMQDDNTPLNQGDEMLVAGHDEDDDHIDSVSIGVMDVSDMEDEGPEERHARAAEEDYTPVEGDGYDLTPSTPRPPEHPRSRFSFSQSSKHQDGSLQGSRYRDQSPHSPSEAAPHAERSPHGPRYREELPPEGAPYGDRSPPQRGPYRKKSPHGPRYREKSSHSPSRGVHYKEKSLHANHYDAQDGQQSGGLTSPPLTHRPQSPLHHQSPPPRQADSVQQGRTSASQDLDTDQQDTHPKNQYRLPHNNVASQDYLGEPQGPSDRGRSPSPLPPDDNFPPDAPYGTSPLESIKLPPAHLEPLSSGNPAKKKKVPTATLR